MYDVHMAVNETRNMNQDLIEGITDGKAIKPSPDRGGVTEPQSQREGLMNEQHGYGVAPVERVADHLYDGGIRPNGPRNHRY